MADNKDNGASTTPLNEVNKSTEINDENRKPQLLGDDLHAKPALPKSKSLNATEFQAHMVSEEAMAATVERLRAQEPPPSLEEARERRASIKEQRRISISLIRSRTASRASANGITLPLPENPQNGRSVEPRQ